MKNKAEKGWPPLVTEEDELKRKLAVAREALRNIKKLASAQKEWTYDIAKKALEEMGSGEGRLSSDGRDVMRTCSPQRGDTKAGSCQSAMAGNPAEPDPAVPSESQGSGGADFDVEAARELAKCVYQVDTSSGTVTAGEWLCSEALTFACDALESSKKEVSGLRELYCGTDDALESARAENERLKAACITFEENSAACVEEFEGRLKAEKRAERAEKEQLAKRVELQVHKQFTEQFITALEKERDEILADNERLKPKITLLHNLLYGGEDEGDIGSYGRERYATAQCAVITKALKLMEKERDEAREDAQAAKEGWREAEDDIEAERKELAKAQRKLDNLEIDCNHDMGIELRQTRAERDTLKAEVARLWALDIHATLNPEKPDEEKP